MPDSDFDGAQSTQPHDDLAPSEALDNLSASDAYSPLSADWDAELDSAISSVSAIQAELNYQQAKATLHNLVTKLDLTSHEQSGLEAEIHKLEGLLSNLERRVVQIAAFGMVGRGKSSLLNALVGEQIFATGPLHGVTRTAARVTWQLSEENIGDRDRYQKVTIQGAGESQIELIDTPGLDEVDGQTRAELATQVAAQADLILFVVSGDITQVEHAALSQLRDAGKPMLLV